MPGRTRLLTAARGGLALSDLETLTAAAPHRIREVLRGVTGRTFVARAARWNADDAGPVYRLAHEVLQAEAERSLGRQLLSGYRDRLHEWAARYAAAGWPAGTPVYLLSGYFSMLRAAGDIPRLIGCATDDLRHDRMLSLSRGDAAAQDEISDAQAVILAQPDPDLAAMARLAMHRDDLAARNAAIPDSLPVLWARLGQLSRAEALAGSLKDHGQQSVRCWIARALADAGQHEDAERVALALTDQRVQSSALAGLAVALARDGHRERAEEVAAAAEAAARLVNDPDGRKWRLISIAEDLAGSGLCGRAEAIARSLTEPIDQVRALAKVAAALAESGRVEQARTMAWSITDPGSRVSLLDDDATQSENEKEWILEQAVSLVKAGLEFQGETLAQSITDWESPSFAQTRGWPCYALAKLAAALGEAGLGDRARQVAESALAGIRSCDEITRMHVLAEVTKALARIGEYNQAETVAWTITAPYLQSEALAEVGIALAGAGMPDQAQRVALAAGSNTYNEQGPLVLVSKALASAGLHDRAEAVARSVNDRFRQAEAITEVMVVQVNAGMRERAEAFAGSIADAGERADAVALVVGRLARSGRHSQAEAFSRLIADPGTRARALAGVAWVLADSGLGEDAARFAEAAEATARTAAGPERPEREAAEELAELAAALADTGLGDQATQASDAARAAAQSINDPVRQSSALYSITHRLADAGLHDAARAAAHSITDAGFRAMALYKVATMLAHAGLHDQAEAAARSIPQPSAALAQVVKGLAGAGQFERAEAVAMSIPDPDLQSRALAELAGKLADAGSLGRAHVVARSIIDARVRAQTLATTAARLQHAGQPDLPAQMAAEAETEARSIPAADSRAWAQADVAAALAADGQMLGHAEAVAKSITEQLMKAHALTAVTVALTRTGRQDHAAQVAEAAAAAARASGNSYTVADTAKELAGIGLLDQAEDLAMSITDTERQADALAQLVEALAATGALGRAQALARSRTVRTRPGAIVKLTDALAAAAQFDQAEAAASLITEADDRARALISVAAALSTAGLHERSRQSLEAAETTAVSLDDSGRKAWLAEKLSDAGFYDAAQTVAQSITSHRDPEVQERHRALTRLAAALTNTGLHDRAEQIANLITDRDKQAETLIGVANALAAGGEPARARQLTARALASRPLVHIAARHRFRGTFSAARHISQPSRSRQRTNSVATAEICRGGETVGAHNHLAPCR